MNSVWCCLKLKLGVKTFPLAGNLPLQSGDFGAALNLVVPLFYR